jgi:hypothetical protein
MEDKLLAGQGRQETRAKLSHFYGLDQRQDTLASTPAAQAVPIVSFKFAHFLALSTILYSWKLCRIQRKSINVCTETRKILESLL